uniref:Uncharacterized protein n=1 Tax=Arundo donax TaxID=35708 RepID=A0A0A8Z0P8_ARUDO
MLARGGASLWPRLDQRMRKPRRRRHRARSGRLWTHRGSRSTRGSRRCSLAGRRGRWGAGRLAPREAPALGEADRRLRPRALQVQPQRVRP